MKVFLVIFDEEMSTKYNAVITEECYFINITKVLQNVNIYQVLGTNGQIV